MNNLEWAEKAKELPSLKRKYVALKIFIRACFVVLLYATVCIEHAIWCDLSNDSHLWGTHYTSMDYSMVIFTIKLSLRWLFLIIPLFTLFVGGIWAVVLPRMQRHLDELEGIHRATC